MPEDKSDNPILQYFLIIRPQLWDAPEWEKVAFLLHYAMVQRRKDEDWNVVTDALAELIPENREFWLRVQATWNAQFLEASTAMFEERELAQPADAEGE